MRPATVLDRDTGPCTGLRTSSPYQAFGGETGLFRRALERYLDVVVGARLDAHAGPDAGPDDLHQLFTSLFEPPSDDGHGCERFADVVRRTAVDRPSRRPARARAGTTPAKETRP